MKPKTEEFLYLMLWSCELLTRPTLRNLTGSFEEWAYRNGFLRRLQALERAQLLEQKLSPPDKRIFRLTEQGRLHVLGGRDPEARWARPWDGRWHLALFDIPEEQESTREKFRRYLRERGFGCLQKSVWISPDPLPDREEVFKIRAQVRSLIFFAGAPAAGETDEQIVSAAWDFERINNLYSSHLRVLAQVPGGRLDGDASANKFRRWAAAERQAFAEAVSLDPLLPKSLLPKDYLGRKSWTARADAQSRVAEQIKSFQPRIADQTLSPSQQSLVISEFVNLFPTLGISVSS